MVALRTIQALAQIDTTSLGQNPQKLADRILAKFDSVAALLRANPERTDLPDDERTFLDLLAIVRDLIDAAYRETLESGPVEIRGEALAQFLKLRLGLKSEECLVLISLDRRGHLLSVTDIAEGALDSVSAPIRCMVRKVLDVGATYVLLAHNHPSGDCRPSQSDIDLTERFGRAFEAVQVRLLDHLVVTQRAIASIRSGERW